ncbi:MAG: serine hydroxymethyltransferase [Fimbriimonadaceae bacterium]|nr:serine hydroxymethyltransferase [Fimbriimonadaceae bacterium]QYK57142.1 MAG: serine hydroxymethyltransferase [Fimbriimonadaceae bacterium]
MTDADPRVAEIISKEERRQQTNLELIASENIASRAVREAMSCVLTDKYAEGYVGKRYYGGCEFADEVESLAISRLKELYGVAFANVQPHSGASANLCVYNAFLKPGDTLMSLSLADGGHLTHGSPVAHSGQTYRIVSYGLKADETIDYDALRKTALAERPKIIVSGASAYSREFDFPFIRQVADEVGAIHLCDMAHYAGLIAGGVYPTPVGHAHIITSTTHKSLRGPRGGIILYDDEAFDKAIRMSVFPGIQGGPLMHIIAAKAVAFGEALQPEFKEYAAQVKRNAQTLAAALTAEGFRIVSGGTDSHLMLVDLRAFGVTGKLAQEVLEKVHITTNRNAIPNDPEKPFVTSGVRLGTPATTTRGMGEDEMRQIAGWIAAALRDHGDESKLARVKEEVLALCARFPIPSLPTP